jgi:hypothetical protein
VLCSAGIVASLYASARKGSFQRRRETIFMKRDSSSWAGSWVGCWRGCGRGLGFGLGLRGEGKVVVLRMGFSEHGRRSAGFDLVLFPPGAQCELRRSPIVTRAVMRCGAVECGMWGERGWLSATHGPTFMAETEYKRESVSKVVHKAMRIALECVKYG